MLTTSERVSIATARGAISAVLHYADDLAPNLRVVVSCPHPLLGGTSDNPVIVAMVQGLVAAGAACVVWEYHPTSECPTPDPSGMDRESFWKDQRVMASSPADLLDIADVSRWLRNLSLGDFHDTVHFAGYSYGAALSMIVEDACAFRLAVSPPIRALGEEVKSHSIRNSVLVRPECDFALTEVEVREIEKARGSAFLAHELIPGADHFLLDQLDIIRELSARWARGLYSPASISPSGEGDVSIPQASNLL